MRRRRSRIAFAAVVAALVLFALAPLSHASYDPISTGQATLTLAPSFKKFLKANGITLNSRLSSRKRPAAGPSAAKGAITLPVATGKADPTIKKADLDLGGELIFARGRLHVQLKALAVKTKPTPLFAKVGGGQLKVAKAATVKLARDGFGHRLTATPLRLTAKTATRLNKRLDTEGFTEGQLLGALTASAVPSTLAVLPSGLMTIVFDPAIYAKLKDLSTSVNPIFPAEHVGPTYTYAIAVEGLIAPDASSGQLRTAGATEFLRLGFGQIFWRDFWLDFAARSLSADLDLEPTPKFLGRLGRTPILALGTGSVSSDPVAHTVTLSGAPLTLTAETAAQFNAAFAEGQPQFLPGELLGTLTFTAQTQ
jgi:hypothetical protein